jgi:SLT domain-containing protein/phage-related protein
VATITRLKFDIDSKYDGKGILAARADIRKFNEELRRMSNKHVKVNVDAQVDPDFGPDFQARLTAIAIARDYHIPVRIDIDEAAFRARMEELANERHDATFNVDADTAAARTKIDAAARNRRAHIDVDADLGIANLFKVAHAARYAALAVGGIVSAFYLIGPAAAVAGAAVMAAMSGGVIAAGIAAIAINDKLTRSYTKAADAARSQANSANTALSDAYRNVATTAAEGAQRIASAEKQAEAATRSSKMAREALTDAYRESGREYEDMVLKLKGAPIDEKGAVIAVERARQRLRELGKNGATFDFLDVQEAQNNIDQALQNLDEIRVRNRRLAEDVVDADEKGIEGSKKVVDAKQKIIDAEDAEKDSVTALAKARTDAAESNRKAAEEVTQAQMRVAEAQDAVNEALRKQNGLAAQAAKFFSDMAAPMRSELSAAMDSIRSKMTDLAPLLQESFRNAAPLIKPYTESLLRFTENILPGLNNGLKESMPIVQGFSDGLAIFGTRLGAMFDKMGNGAEGLGNTWRVFADEFGRFFEIIGDGAGRMSETGSQSLRLFLGAFNDLFQGMIDGAVPAMEAMAGGTSIWHGLFVSIGDFFRVAGPAIGQFTEAISDVLEPSLRAITPAIANVVGAFLNSLTPIIISVTPLIVDVANGFADLLTKLSPVMDTLGPVIAGLWLLNAALAANPIGIVVIGVAALAGGITYLATKTQFFQDLWAKMEPIIKPVWEAIQNFGHMLAEVFGPKIHDIVEAAKGAFADLKEQWETSIKPAFSQLMETLGPLWEQLKPILGAIGVAILAIGSGLLGAIQHSIKPIMQFIGDTIKNVVDAIKGVVETITGIIQFFKGFVEVVFNIGSAIAALFTGDWDGFKDSIGGIVNGIRDIGEGVIGIFTGLWHIVKATWDEIVSVLKNGVGLIIGVVRGFIDGVIGFFEHLFDVLVGHSIVPDLMDKIIDLFMWLPRKVIAFVQDLVDGVIKLWDFLSNKWDECLQGWKVILETVSKVIHDIWEKFWNKIKETGQSIWETITSAFTGFSDGVKSVLEGVVHKAQEIWDGIKGIFARPINAVIGFWNDTIADKIGLGDKKIPVIPGYADGGPVAGAGGGRQDKIRADLSHGEYVVNARAAFMNRALLDRMNFGGEVIPAYANGGPVEWMESWMSAHHPGMKVTSDYRDSNDYHGIGKAVDFASSVSEMLTTASDVASTWGKNTLELIHGNGFAHNIKNGQDVGDGMSFYKPGTMAEHNNHLHWAVDKPLDESQGGQGFFDRIGDAVGGAVNRARDLVSGVFNKLTDPVLSVIPDPFAAGMGGAMGSFPKSAATKIRDNIADLIKGREASVNDFFSGDIGGVIPSGDRLKIIDDALALTNTPPPGTLDEWRRGMNTLIGRESGWNAGAVNNTDINAKNGVPSKGLAQVIGPTFEANKVPGHDNIYDPVSNVAASINYIKGRYGNISNVQQANENMPPKGYEDGTDYAKPGWNLVGENGPEMVKFRGGEEVHSFDEIIERLKGVNVEGRTQQAIQSAVKSNFDTFVSDLTGGSIGDGFLGQLVTQGLKYGQELSSWNLAKGDTHYHVSSAEELIRLEKQKRREEAMGFDN